MVQNEFKMIGEEIYIPELTPEQWEEVGKEVDRYEEDLAHKQIESNYYGCGAAKSMLERADFKNFKIVDSPWEARNSQTILRNLGNQFLEKTREGKYCNLIMCGKPGAGKTFTALCVMREICSTPIDIEWHETNCMKEKWPVSFLKGWNTGTYRTSDWLCEEIKQSSSFTAKVNKYKLIEKYATVPLLIIDEIGRTNNKVEKDTLFSILDRRYQEGKNTILITNLEEEKLRGILGEALMDRLMEGCLLLNNNFFQKCPSMRVKSWQS